MRKRYLLVPVLVLGLLAVTSAPGRRAISVAVLDLARGGTIGGATTISGDLTVNGDAGVSNNARVTGTLGVTGAATFGTIVSAPILDGGAVIGTTANFSGDIHADHYHSVALATENSFYVPAQTYYCGNDPTCTANFQFDGAAWAFTPDFHGQDAGFNNISASAHIFTANTSGDLRFSATNGPGLTYGGATTVQTTAGVGFASLSTLQGQSVVDVWDSLRNTATGANCTGHTGSVCVNDSGGLCWTDGSGTTVGCLNTDGTITSTMAYDFAFNATSLATTGTTVVQEFGATAAASTVIAVNWTPLVVGVGGGNFVVKYCGDSTCAGTTYATCTAACTAAVGTPVACTINTAAMAKGADPFLKITTACATTNPQGAFVAHHSQP